MAVYVNILLINVIIISNLNTYCIFFHNKSNILILSSNYFIVKTYLLCKYLYVPNIDNVVTPFNNIYLSVFILEYCGLLDNCAASLLRLECHVMHVTHVEGGVKHRVCHVFLVRPAAKHCPLLRKGAVVHWYTIITWCVSKTVRICICWYFC